MLALVGAMLAPFVLERMTDHGFRQWTRAIIFTIAAVYLVRGGLLLWQGGVTLRASGEHLDLAVDRHQPGFDLELRVTSH